VLPVRQGRQALPVLRAPLALWALLVMTVLTELLVLPVLTVLTDLPVLPVDEVETAYYLRLHAQDRPGVLAKVATILSERGINIESIMQKDVEEQDGLVPMILLTHRVREQNMNDAIAALESLEDIAGPLMRIRVEQLD